jgi:hypothetical protein
VLIDSNDKLSYVVLEHRGLDLGRSLIAIPKDV